MSVEQVRSNDYTTSQFIMKLLGSMPELNQDRMPMNRKQPPQKHSNPSLKNIENSVELGSNIKDMDRSPPLKIKTNSKQMQLFRMFYEIAVSRLMEKEQADGLWKMFENSMDEQNKFTSFLKKADGIVAQSAGKVKEKWLKKIKEQIEKKQKKIIGLSIGQQLFKQEDQFMGKEQKRVKKIRNSYSNKKEESVWWKQLSKDRKSDVEIKSRISEREDTVKQTSCPGYRERKSKKLKTDIRTREWMKEQIKNVVKIVQHGHKFLHK